MKLDLEMAVEKECKIRVLHPAKQTRIKESDMWGYYHKGSAQMANNQFNPKEPMYVFEGNFYQHVGAFYIPMPDSRDYKKH